MSDEQKTDYAVGYGKPPEATRFKPGESGNRKGRPKGAKNLSTIVGNAIKEKVVVTDKGKRKSVSKLEVAVMQLMNKAASGDQKALAMLLPLVQIVEGKAEAATAHASRPEDVHEADKAVMDGILQRMRRANASVSSTSPAPSETASPEPIHQQSIKEEI